MPNCPSSLVGIRIESNKGYFNNRQILNNMTDNFDLNRLVPMLSDDMVEEDTEFIPLLSSEDEDQMNSEKVPDELSILPLRNTVCFRVW